MTYESIESLSRKYPLTQICRALNVSRSSYLYWLNKGKHNKEKRAHLFAQIIEVYATSNGLYGAGKISKELASKGIKCSTSNVSKIMDILGIRCVYSKKIPRRKSKLSAKDNKIIFNRIKGLNIVRPNQVRTTDITYIKTIYEGNYYLITFIDYFSKKVVGWGLFDNQSTESVLKVLSKAVAKRKPGPGLVIHSDKGTQFRSQTYLRHLKKHNFIVSYTSLNHSCDENAAQESFHALLKKESLYLKKLYNYEDAYREIYNYIEGFYNPIRIHSSIGYLSPIQYEKRYNSMSNPL